MPPISRLRWYVTSRGYCPIVEGKRVTGFASSEEEGVRLTVVVPLLVRDELKARDGEFDGCEDWGAFIVTDDLLTTGQNLRCLRRPPRRGSKRSLSKIAADWTLGPAMTVLFAL